MQNDYLDTQILLNEEHLHVLPGTIISGQIIFSPKIDLNVQELGYKVIMFTNGDIKSYSKVLTHDIFLRNKKLKKGKNSNYNFEFVSSSPSSYNGHNIDVIWKVESMVNLQTNSYLQIRNDYLKKNNLPFHTDTLSLLWQKDIFKVIDSDQPYTVEVKNETIENSSSLTIVIFATIIFTIAVFGLYFELDYQFDFF